MNGRRVTAADILKMRADSEAGLTIVQCAAKTGIPYGTIYNAAKRYRIKFRPVHFDGVGAPDPRALALAKKFLAEEIRAAKAEASWSRPYKGGWGEER